jgi:cbb3-type cytochrome c oxidase subunit III
VIKSLASLLLASVLAASALPTLAQHTAPAAGASAAAASAAAPAASGPSAAPTTVAAATAKPDLAQGDAKFTAVCAACHGAGGNSGTPANPKLAQQHPDYIVKQLQEFKSGKRPSPIMQGFAAQLTEQDMKNIAAYVTSQKAKPGFAKDKELVTLGEKLYRGGLQSRMLPACAGCHSPNGAGIPAQYPRLSGQHADYTAGQLVAFRDGVRKNSPQMQQIAAKMSDREIRAVADYIAGLR